MVDFDNVNLEFQNVSTGPDSGRVYSIDHINSVMVVKTNPGGTLVSTIPLNSTIQNEVKTLQYDGFYFWTQNDIGSSGDLGTVIQKWEISGGLLRKVIGGGNQIILNKVAGAIYESEAMVIRTYETSFSSFTASGSSSITIDSTSFLQPGDDIYLGPSSASSGEREVRSVNSVIGNIVTLNSPTTVNFNVGDSVIYRKDTWVFNNYNLLNPNSGSLLQIDGYSGYLLATISSGEWQHVTAAASKNGDLVFVRGSQFLQYRPFGTNAGYQTSLLLNNIDNDREFIKVYDIFVDSISVSKLQKTLHYFNTTTEEFEDIDSLNDNFNIEQELFAANVKSLTIQRNESFYFGEGVSNQFTVEVRDQYNVPVLGRSVSVSDDDASGFIEAGFESFTTDSNGQGITRYNSGITPNFALPEIKVQDVGTGFNLKSILVQIPFTDSSAPVVQDTATASNLTYITQFKSESNLTLEQRRALESIFYLIQLEISAMRIYITQYLNDYFINIIQKEDEESEILINQLEKISDTTTVTQYDFLIFAVPVPFSIKNSPDTNILVRIVGFGALTLEPSSLLFKVNNIDVSDQVTITPFSGGLELLYNPTENFPYSSTVSVFIQIEDNDSPANIISTSYTFDIVPDTKIPFLSEVYPPDQSTGNDENTEIYAIIKDLETGIDINTIEMFVEGKKITPTINVIDDNTVKVSYTPSCAFPFLSTITVSVIAEDNEGNKFIGSWSFTVKSSSGVLFTTIDPENCNVLVPIDTNICSEVFGLSEGINIKTLTFDVNGNLISYLLKPKVYRKE